MDRLDSSGRKIILGSDDRRCRHVSSVSWDRHSSTDDSPVALLGYKDGSFRRIDDHHRILQSDRLFTSRVSVNDIVSFSEVSFVCE